MVIVAKEGFKGLNSVIVIWVMVLFYFGIFHLMPFNSAYMSKCELVTNLWRHYWSYNNPPDVMKTRLMVQAKRELNDQENALIGAFAGAITGAITTPLDVMKTRVMVQGHGSQYSGIVSCAQTILREEGSRAFLKGIEPRVLWIGIGGSIFFGVLEKTKSMLAGRRNREVGTLKDE